MKALGAVVGIDYKGLLTSCEYSALMCKTVHTVGTKPIKLQQWHHTISVSVQDL